MQYRCISPQSSEGTWEAEGGGAFTLFNVGTLSYCNLRLHHNTQIKWLIFGQTKSVRIETSAIACCLTKEQVLHWVLGGPPK